MVPYEKKQAWIFGALFGAWMGGVYALVTGGMNAFLLPNIPLAPPEGGFVLYFLGYIAFGAALGLVSSIPENKLVGLAFGGLATAVILVIVTLTRTWGFGNIGGTLVSISCTFLPLIVLSMPISLMIRAGVDAQHIEPDKPYLWARKYLIPLALTLVAVVFGLFSLYSAEQKQAFIKVNQLISDAKPASQTSELPKPLLDVEGYLENAKGSYMLSYSDQVDTFFGPRPAGNELSQFLIIARFENGFSFACVFSNNRQVPNCALY